MKSRVKLGSHVDPVFQVYLYFLDASQVWPEGRMDTLDIGEVGKVENFCNQNGGKLLNIDSTSDTEPIND
jgi:hypothetical protein